MTPKHPSDSIHPGARDSPAARVGDEAARLVEREMRRPEAHLAGIISLATDAIVSVDGDYRIVLFNTGAETINYESTDVAGELRERSGGRGPDVCIEAVGMEAHSSGPAYAYDQLKQQLRLQTDRPNLYRRMKRLGINATRV